MRVSPSSPGPIHDVDRPYISQQIFSFHIQRGSEGAEIYLGRRTLPHTGETRALVVHGSQATTHPASGVSHHHLATDHVCASLLRGSVGLARSVVDLR